MFRNKQKITNTFHYALVEYVETGKIFAGYAAEDLITALDNSSIDEWDEVKQLFNLQCSLQHKSIAKQKSLISKQVIALGVIGALVIYHETQNVLQAMSFGLVSASLSYFSINNRSSIMTDKIKSMQAIRMQNILKHEPLSAKNKQESNSMTIIKNHLQVSKKELEYKAWCELLDNVELPAIIVDLKAFDANVKQLAQIAKESKKQIRIATKSIRVLELLKRAIDLLGEYCSGLMCYSAKEADFLHQNRIRKIFIAYPTLQQKDLQILRKLHNDGADISIVVDCEEHMHALNHAMEGVNNPFAVVIDIDLSIRFPFDMGVRRSSIRTLQDVHSILRASKKFANIKPIGAMGYEAAAAAISDVSSNGLVDAVMHQIRVRSFEYAKKMRAGVREIFENESLKLEFFNGGGSCTLNWSGNDSALTELAVGNAFLDPHIISCSNIIYNHAVYVALQVVRSSNPHEYITCGLGGGIVASGDKKHNLQLVSPSGLQPTANEGFGEVQTPFKITGSIYPNLGSPVLFRPAKGGEATEHFNDVLLIDKGKVARKTKTYRGQGLGPG